MIKKNGLLKPNWQHFYASVIFAVLFPMLPLGIEFGLGSSVGDSTILIAAIMYCSSLSVVSNSVLIFGLGFVVSILLSISFGITFYNSGIAPLFGRQAGILCMGFFALMHCLQRYDTHVIKCRDFIDFGSAS